MKPINLNIDDNDIKAILAAIEAMISSEPDDTFEDEEDFDAFISIYTSTSIKLASHKPLSNQETFAAALAVDSAYKALRGELPMDSESIDLLKEYIFIFNKLQPMLSPILDM